MVIMTSLALVLGIASGLASLQIPALILITNNSKFILYLLMLLVGISIGLHRGLLEQIKKHHLKIFIIPLGIVIGSAAGGVICSLITGIELHHSTAIASGLGWYSLAGVAIGNLAGVQMGSIAFLSNLMREIFSFFCIPFISKHLNYYTCIAPAGATSEDTTLPMMIKYTNEETVVLSVLNGVICSALVPILISFCYKFF